MTRPLEQIGSRELIDLYNAGTITESECGWEFIMRITPANVDELVILAYPEVITYLQEIADTWKPGGVWRSFAISTRSVSFPYNEVQKEFPTDEQMELLQKALRRD